MDNLKSTSLWLNEFDVALKCRERCIGFTFNHDDYVLSNETPVFFDQFIKDYFKEKGSDLVLQYSLSEGITFYEVEDDAKSIKQFEKYTGLMLQNCNGNKNDQLSPLMILRGLDKLLRQSSLKVALLIKYGEHLVPNNPANGGLSQTEVIIVEELITSWVNDPVIASTENTVVILFREGYVSESIREKWRFIRIDLPNSEEREEFINVIVKARTLNQKKEFAVIEEDLNMNEISKLTSGLSLRSIEKLFRRGSVSDNGKLTKTMVKNAKANEIRKLCGDLLEVFDTDNGFESIAGMKYIKDYFSRLKMQLQKGGCDIVRAILMIGVPGVGKSFSVRAFAKELGFNCVALRSVRSMWVGESERNLERAFNAIEALSPAILFFDEIDQALGQRGAQGDSGVSQRMLARIWEFMATERLRGKIIFMAASNMPSLLDPATKDRFGVTIPFLLPTLDEMKSLIPVLSSQLNLELSSEINIANVASLLTEKKISPRQALDVISMARTFSLVDSTSTNALSESHLIRAAQSFQSNADPLQIERITLEAIRMTTFRELLPWHGMTSPLQLPAYSDSVVDENTCEIDYNKLNDRLSQIQNSLYMRGIN